MELSYQLHFINDQTANLVIESAIKQANQLGLKICICVLDPSGRMKAFRAMDDAANIAYEACIKKAKTAVGFGLPTGKAWYDFIKNDPIMLAGAQHLPDFILLGGGSPIYHNDKLIGAIGISGGHYEQDEKCVQAALECLKKNE